MPDLKEEKTKKNLDEIHDPSKGGELSDSDMEKVSGGKRGDPDEGGQIN